MCSSWQVRYFLDFFTLIHLLFVLHPMRNWFFMCFTALICRLFREAVRTILLATIGKLSDFSFSWGHLKYFLACHCPAVVFLSVLRAHSIWMILSSSSLHLIWAISVLSSVSVLWSIIFMGFLLFPCFCIILWGFIWISADFIIRIWIYLLSLFIGLMWLPIDTA